MALIKLRASLIFVRSVQPETNNKDRPTKFSPLISKLPNLSLLQLGVNLTEGEPYNRLSQKVKTTKLEVWETGS